MPPSIFPEPTKVIPNIIKKMSNEASENLKSKLTKLVTSTVQERVREFAGKTEAESG